MKTLKYTLLELMVAMLIFVIMMGILMSTFSMAADVASSEGNKLSIMSDSNVFYTYVTRDFGAVLSQPIPAPIYIDDDGSTSTLQKWDPDATTPPPDKLDDYGLNIEYVANEKISFYSDTKEYSSLTTNLESSADYVLKVEYEFKSTEEKIVRTMYVWDSLNDSAAFPPEEATILEGVKEFSFTIWENYAGGREITATNGKLETVPACITFNVTITNPNPSIPDIIKERHKRTVSKTVYLN